MNFVVQHWLHLLVANFRKISENANMMWIWTDLCHCHQFRNMELSCHGETM